MYSKILTVVYSLAKGGTQRAAQNFATAYCHLGFDSRVLCTEINGIRKSQLEEKGVPVYMLVTPDNLGLIQDWNPEVVHVHSHGLSADCFRSLKHLLPDSKYIETNVFSQPSDWIKDLDISLQLSCWCLWLYTTRVRGLYPCATVPYPIDTTSFQNAGSDRVRAFKAANGIREDEIVIGRIGQSYDSKWSLMLVDVFHELKRFHPRLLLLLVNPPVSIQKRAACSPFASDIVEIESLYTDSSLQECYSSIDVFVHIADQGESFGMVLAESLLCETPVVTLATPWGDNSQGEVVGNHIGGYVATTKKSLIKHVNNLILNPKLRAKLGRDGRQRIIDLFDSRIVAAKALESINLSESSTSKITPLPPADISTNPLKLMQNTVGDLDLLTQFILFSQSNFDLLRYSTGYEKRGKLWSALVNRIYCRLRRLLGRFKQILID